MHVMITRKGVSPFRDPLFYCTLGLVGQKKKFNATHANIWKRAGSFPKKKCQAQKIMFFVYLCLQERAFLSADKSHSRIDELRSWIDGGRDQWMEIGITTLEHPKIGVILTSRPARKALFTVRLYPALRTSRESVTSLVQPAKQRAAQTTNDEGMMRGESRGKQKTSASQPRAATASERKDTNKCKD